MSASSSLPAGGLSQTRGRHRASQGRTSGLVLIGANLIGLTLVGCMVADESNDSRDFGAGVTIPDMASAEEQPSKTANATAASDLTARSVGLAGPGEAA